MSRHRSYRRRNVARPDNAVREADDLVAIGQAEDGWKVLHKSITSRRRQFFQPTHEAMMKRYVELCVMLKKNAKDGLYKFRNMCTGRNGAAGNLDVIEGVLRHYVEASKDAGGKELQSIAEDVEKEWKGTEADEKKHAESDEVKTDIPTEEKEEFVQRQFQSPVLKYQWDSMKSTLDVSKNNAKLQDLYHDTTRTAIQFCQSLNRTSEFRRLTADLRYHLRDIHKYPNQDHSITLKNPDTLAIYLQIRFELLKSATTLKLWTEAYKLIEDIHALLKVSEKPLEPELLRMYYEKLAEIFWESKNYLFHAHCYHKYYNLSVEAKVEEIDAIGQACVLATLSIDRWDESEQFHTSVSRGEDKDKKLGEILSLDGIPRRSSLLKKLIQQKLIDPRDKSGLYYLLEKSFYPLQLTKKVLPLIEAFETEPSHKKYAKTMKTTLTYRLLQQLSNVYDTFKLSNLRQLLPDSMEFADVEKLIVSNDSLSIKVDHQHELLHFAETEMESRRMRSQLTMLAKSLSEVTDKIHPHHEYDKRKQREAVFKKVKAGCHAERKSVFQRLSEIEKAKQEREAHKHRVAMDLRRLEEKKRREEKKMELTRRQQGQENREKVRKDREKKLKEEEERKKLLQKINQEKGRKLKPKSTQPPNNVIKPPTPAAASGPKNAWDNKPKEAAPKVEEEKKAIDDLKKELLDLEKKKEEKQKKALRDDSLRHDYLVRAYRLEEKPLLLEEFEKQKKADAEYFAAEAAKNREENQRRHQFMLNEKRRLARMHKHMQEYHENMMVERRDEFEHEKKRQEEAKEQHDKTRARYLERIRIFEERAAAEKKRKEDDERAKREKEESEREKKRIEDEENEIRQANELRKQNEAKSASEKATSSSTAGASSRPGASDSTGLTRRANTPWRPTKVDRPLHPKPPTESKHDQPNGGSAPLELREEQVEKAASAWQPRRSKLGQSNSAFKKLLRGDSGGGAAPSTAASGASKPQPSKPARSDPFGGARPAGDKPTRSSPFGGAKPVDERPARTIFGGAKPDDKPRYQAGRGRGRLTDRPGGDRPTARLGGGERPSGRLNPFGGGRPRGERPGGSRSSDPFGNAGPATGDAPPRTGGAPLRRPAAGAGGRRDEGASKFTSSSGSRRPRFVNSKKQKQDGKK